MLFSPIRRVLSLLLTICLLCAGLAGCSSDDDNFVGDGGQGETATITYQTVLAKAVPSIVTTYRFTGRDGNNALVFGPASSPKQPTVTLIVPRSLVYLTVEYLDAQNNVIGIVNVTVDVSGGSATVTDPDFASPGGDPAQLGFGVQPSNIGPGGVISPAVTVEIEDENGATVTTSNAAVTIALGNNPSNATLGGTLTVNAVNGVATFNDLTLNNVGSGYTLVASSGTLDDGISNSFSVLQPGNPAQLVFTGTVGNAEENDFLTGVTVEVRDANNILVPTANNSVTIQFDNNPGNATLGGTTTVAAVNGVATFSNLSVSGSGNGFTLSAEAANLTPDTSNAFNITPDSNQGLTVDFANAVNLPLNNGNGGAGTNPQEVAVGDVNNDGNLDVVVANVDQDNISIFPGNGNGTFGAEVTKTTDDQPVAVVVGDFTGDGDNDIAVACSGDLNVFPGDNTLNFNTREDYAGAGAGRSFRGMCSLDLTGDGDLDLALSDFGQDSVQVFVNDGSGVFSVEQYASNNNLEGARSIVAADFNADNRPDLAISSFTSGNGCYVWLNTGTATNYFPQANLSNTLTAPSNSAASQAITTLDLDDDGDRDVVATYTDGNNSRAVPYLNNGSGEFSTGTAIFCSQDPFGAAAADFDDDGLADVVSGSAFGLGINGTGEIDILLSNGNGSLAPQLPFAGLNGQDIRSVAVGDFNEDGLPDVAAAGSTAMVFINTSF